MQRTQPWAEACGYTGVARNGRKADGRACACQVVKRTKRDLARRPRHRAKVRGCEAVCGALACRCAVAAWDDNGGRSRKPRVCMHGSSSAAFAQGGEAAG